ncbi:MAG: ATP-dependent 6-phosphofructokinase [Dehalococcoidales bacterium]|nr:MAG: ATP-dependent 6-phosphofructokinase [Dehalococcoidales bacterium]
MEGKRRIGILTSGGDCPGLNAAIRAAAKTAMRDGYGVIGINHGWQGFLDNDYQVLDGMKTSGIIDRGGTILGTSRLSPFYVENGPQFVFDGVKELGLEGLVVLGGDGTLAATDRLYRMGLPVVGIPKTIDNDVRGTDFSIGFQTAVQIATDALDRLRSYAESHHRVMLLEVMGRHAGWIATYAGMANGADAILIPEIPMDSEKIDALCRMLLARNEKGISFSIVVVAEGTRLDGRTVEKPVHDRSRDGQERILGGIADVLGGIIAEKTDLEIRVSTLGYVQRGGTPVAYDRSLATAFGVKAVELITHREFGQMTALKGNRVTSVPLEIPAGGTKTLNLNIYRVAEKFFG